MRTTDVQLLLLFAIVLLFAGQDTVAIVLSQRNEEQCKNKGRPSHRLPKLNCLPPVVVNVVTTALLLSIAWLSLILLCQRLGIVPHDLVLLVAMVIASYLSGQVFLLCGLPQVVPMYLIGIAFRSFGLFEDLRNWAVFSNLRYLAITVILVKGGLAVDLKAMKKYPTQVLKSSFIICTVEAMAMTVAVNIFLPNMFPPLWSFVFGFVNSPTSPTKFGSVLAGLKATKLYTEPKMGAIWGFSASVEIIYCISVFSILLSIITRSSGGAMETLFLGIAKVALGFLVGTVWGLVVGYLPHKDDINSSAKRFAGLWLGVISIYFGAKSYGWGPGGPLGTFVGGISANTVWTALDPSLKKTVLKSFNRLWDWVMEPILFSLVGYEIDANVLPMSPAEVGLTVAALLVGLLFRCLISAAVHYTSGFNRPEVVFLTIAGIPKATVQAAISPQMLDLLCGTEDENRSKALVFSGIISCLIFTTVSTLILHIFSRRLLRTAVKPVPTIENKNMP